MRNPGDYLSARAEAEANRAPSRVVNVLKSAGSAGTMANVGAIADYQTMASAFAESLRSQSIFDALLAGGMYPGIAGEPRFVPVGLQKMR
jgi:hypothetical protein